MKKKDLQELKNKQQDELKNLIAKKVVELDRLRVELKAGREKNVRVLKTGRHNLARMKTLLKEEINK